MRGLDPRIHVFAANEVIKTWMAGSSPAMTTIDCMSGEWKGACPRPQITFAAQNSKNKFRPQIIPTRGLFFATYAAK